MLPRYTFPSPLLCVPFLLLSSSHGWNETKNRPTDQQPKLPNDQPRVSNNQPRTFYIGGVLSSETTAHAFTMEAQVNIINIAIIIFIIILNLTLIAIILTLITINIATITIMIQV